MEVDATDCVKDKMSGRFLSSKEVSNHRSKHLKTKEINKGNMKKENETLDVFGDPVLTKIENRTNDRTQKNTKECVDNKNGE